MEKTLEMSDTKIDKKTEEKSQSLWSHAFTSLKKDRVAVGALFIVTIYILVTILSFTGLLAGDWGAEVGPSYMPPSMDSLSTIFGTDIFGRSVLAKTIKGAEIAMSVGFVSATIAAIIGVTLGALAGYFGGKVDEGVVWFYTTFASIPWIMLVIAITSIAGRGVSSVYIALGLTSWVSLCRLIRGEVIKHKDREYVHAASAIGQSELKKLFKHIIPNVLHIVIINFSLTFQRAIKSEVILSYLGLGVQSQPSWGKMIDDAKLELARDVWWQLAAASVAMFFIVLAFNLLGDALRDALDPKLKGK